MASSYAAVDLGAESGRVILGTLEKNSIQIQEVHRFPNGGVQLGSHRFWDVLGLWSEIKVGLSKAGAKAKGELASIGLDTWGIDFGLLTADDRLVGNPFHYRDSRTDGMLETAFGLRTREDIYAATGIQFMQINSLYQLLSMVQTNAAELSIARTFLNIPDLFNFFLTGEKANEFTIATTTQCYNPKERSWAYDLLESMGIPTQIFGQIVPPGTILGGLRPTLADELNMRTVSVVASAGHDTASAVAAVPASSEDYLYLSSGTWSLMGVELDQPLINADTLHANMTNEGGVGNTIRFLKNIVGLWLVQECRRQWAYAGTKFAYADLTQMAAAAPAFGSLINPEDQRFLAPKDMSTAIQSYCQETGQKVLHDKGAIIRCVLESLALEYRWVTEQIGRLTGMTCPVIHIIGGGAQNQLLNQFAASATGRTVIAGPVEATAIGNILVQAIAMGEIASLDQGRELVSDSFELKTFRPIDTAAWDEAFAQYRELKKR